MVTIWCAVCILSRIKTAFRVCHVPQHIFENLSCDLCIPFFLCYLICLKIHISKNRLVMEHLLKMRKKPLLVGRIPMEPASYTVKGASVSHVVQGIFNHLERLFVGRSVIVAQKKRESMSCRKFWSSSKSTVGWVILR